MPEPIRQVFRICHGEQMGLRRKAKMCRELWSDKATIALLNQTAPWFFHDVRWALFDDMHLAIARLTDPAKTGKKENLALERLIDMVVADQPQDSLLAQELRDHLDAARNSAQAILGKRNTMIAHNDLPTVTSDEVKFLRAGINTLDTIFQEFESILSKIQVCYKGQPIPPDFLEVGHDAYRLVDALRKGEEAIKRLNAGTPKM